MSNNFKFLVLLITIIINLQADARLYSIISCEKNNLTYLELTPPWSPTMEGYTLIRYIREGNNFSTLHNVFPSLCDESPCFLNESKTSKLVFSDNFSKGDFLIDEEPKENLSCNIMNQWALDQIYFQN